MLSSAAYFGALFAVVWRGTLLHGKIRYIPWTKTAEEGDTLSPLCFLAYASSVSHSMK